LALAIISSIAVFSASDHYSPEIESQLIDCSGEGEWDVIGGGRQWPMIAGANVRLLLEFAINPPHWNLQE
jgi:hypothetical protein